MKDYPMTIIKKNLCKKVFLEDFESDSKREGVTVDLNNPDNSAERTEFRGRQQQFRFAAGEKEVTGAKLERGQVKYQENSKGIVPMKWKDKREVLIVSGQLLPTGKINRIDKPIIKPEVIIHYKFNAMEGSVDIAHQLASYEATKKHKMVP
ncbi:hypothetical protein ILUMI_07695 [Ignelater luminosus]|uniref:Uncharacterized protein n=1 Tax=Ignelater luminosus TaxID=2038154 RepID=A0A8K0GE52_IGNLU|nr:hypothetical protein ILUMI_07695 [Ignelater luminosus]